MPTVMRHDPNRSSEGQSLPSARETARRHQALAALPENANPAVQRLLRQGMPRRRWPVLLLVAGALVLIALAVLKFTT